MVCYGILCHGLFCHDTSMLCYVILWYARVVLCCLMLLHVVLCRVRRYDLLSFYDMIRVDVP